MKLHEHQHYIDGLKARDAKTIEKVYNDFFPAIQRYVLKNRGNEDDAHDVFQEGMQMLYHEATTKNFIIKSGLNNWLFMVCRNVWYKKLNKKAKMPVTSDDNLDLKDEDDIESRMMAHERKQLYLRKFQKLSEKCQQILALFFEKTKLAAIADQLGYKNANVVKKKKSGCQKKLTQLIQEDPLFQELTF